MAGQYSYGESKDVVAQAAKLLDRLMSKVPFAQGNRRTAFIATLTFLNANGYATKPTDQEAAQLILSLRKGQITAQQAIEALAAPASENLSIGVTLRKLITHEFNLHSEALRALANDD
jgi:death-on-curing protein